LKAKKSYGQHFLIQKKVIDRIASAILAELPARIMEIGPGKGAITSQLLNKTDHFIAIDADHDMVEYLHQNYPNNRDQIIQADFLQVDLKQFFDQQAFLLCGNFPYNISSQIVFKMLDNTNQIPIMLGMFQKEMAKRILAVPGSKDYGIISVLTSLRYHGKILFDIGPNNFSPPPRVISSFLILHRNTKSISDDLFNKTKTLVKIAFHSRRKTLRNNLKTIISDPSILEDAFFDQRAENLLPQDYLVLVEQIKPYLNSSLILE